MANPNLYGHNIVSFDLDWLLRYGLECNDVNDTMVMFNRLYPELPKGLDFLTMLYTDLPYYKMDGSTWGTTIPNERLHSYCAKDCIGNLRCVKPLEAEMSAQSSVAECYTRARNQFGLVLEMQNMGLELDEGENNAERDIIVPRLNSVYALISDLTDGALVVRPKNKQLSNTDVHKYLYDTLGLPKQYNRKARKRAVTADEDALVNLMLLKPALRLLTAMMEERHLSKALQYVNTNFKEVE